MKSSGMGKIFTVARQQLTQHLLVIVLAPDLHVYIELFGPHDELTRIQRSAGAGHCRLQKAIENDRREDGSKCGTRSLLRSIDIYSVFDFRLRSASQVRPFQIHSELSPVAHVRRAIAARLHMLAPKRFLSLVQAALYKINGSFRV